MKMYKPVNDCSAAFRRSESVFLIMRMSPTPGLIRSNLRSAATATRDKALFGHQSIDLTIPPTLTVRTQRPVSISQTVIISNINK